MKILYLDKKSDSKELLSYLLDLGFDVRWVESVHDAKTQILLEDFDLLISEVNVDDGNGLDFLRDIQKECKIKSIIVSKNKDPEQLLKALELQVEKYLTKPLNLEELKSTIIKSLSLTNAKENTFLKDSIELGAGYIYNPLNNQITTKDGDNIVLTQQELSLVQRLVEQKGSYCSHENLQTAIGIAGGPTTIDTLRTVVKKIRKKTYENIIESLSGVGYKINIPSLKDKQDISSLISIKPIEKKILVAKGNEKRSTALQRKLAQYGFTCEEVFLLKEAKEALEHEKFDYIIIDLQLPDGDGADLLRDKPTIDSNRIIILSNSEDMHYKEYLYFKGIVDYIEKRDDLDYLAYSIYQTISKVESNNIYNNILLVESSKKIAEQIKDILLPRNYNVDVTSSADKVINLINHKSYNLIILDLEIEDINSLEFLITLKKHVDKALPIIMLSAAQRSYSLVRDCYVNGAVECLRKPIFAEEFILKIDQWSEYYKQTLEIKDNHRLLSSYKSIVDNTVILSKTDPDGIITYANEMFCNISQYSRDELIGQPHNIVRHPDMKASVFKDMWHTISKEKKIWSGVLKNKKKDGTHYILSTYIMPVLDYNNNVTEFIALRNDITDIKR